MIWIALGVAVLAFVLVFATWGPPPRDHVDELVERAIARGDHYEVWRLRGRSGYEPPWRNPWGG